MNILDMFVNFWLFRHRVVAQETYEGNGYHIFGELWIGSFMFVVVQGDVLVRSIPDLDRDKEKISLAAPIS